MSFTIRNATVRDACFVAANMRPQDWREISALIGDVPRRDAACWMLASSRRPSGRTYAWQVEEDGQPIACFGFSYVYEHVASAWSYGTNRMCRAIVPITGWSQVYLPMLFEVERQQRVEVRTIVDHDISHRWLNRVGAKEECFLPSYGRNGEPFVLYAWTRTEMPIWKAKLGHLKHWHRYTEDLTDWGEEMET
jgi:hypothetical protein